MAVPGGRSSGELAAGLRPELDPAAHRASQMAGLSDRFVRPEGEGLELGLKLVWGPRSEAEDRAEPAHRASVPQRAAGIVGPWSGPGSGPESGSGSDRLQGGRCSGYG